MAIIREVPRVYLGSGNRIVERIEKKYVIKFGCPENCRTGGQNRIEGDTWNKFKDDPHTAPFLVPVVDYDPHGAWLIMPYVSQKVRTLTYDESEKWKYRIEKQGFGFSTADFGPRNLGFNEAGEIVALDYGYRQGKFSWNDRGRCGSCEHCRLHKVLQEKGVL